MYVGGTMSSVVVTGTVQPDGGRLVLVPTGPDDSESVVAVELRGQDLPPTGARVAVSGELADRSLQVAGWQREPDSTSAWSTTLPGVEGVAAEVSHQVTDSIPDDWPIISVGEAKLPSGNWVCQLEVEQVTPEIRDWLNEQPDGAVHLISFIS